MKGSVGLGQLIQDCGFSSVLVSCVMASPLAMLRSRRRMILPLRVLGRLSPKRMSWAGNGANLSWPPSCATRWRSAWLLRPWGVNA